jgi:DeoR family transcriptional regulator, fructose operon transcriptional repressor
MLVEERRKRVLDLVSARGFVPLTDLVHSVGASDSTIRRDLKYLHEQGKLKRTRGGAAIYVGDLASLPALEERSGSQVDEKKLVARAAAARIQDGDTVLLDGGTTTLEVARLLVRRSLQVVTNSLPVASLLSGSREIELVLLGGFVYPKTGVALGPLTVRSMEDVHVNQLIMSVGGITEKGLFNSNLLLVETERRMMSCADRVTVVADHTKINRQALAFLCGLGDIDTLIVDGGLDRKQRALLSEAAGEAAVELIVADEAEGNHEDGAGPRPR